MVRFEGRWFLLYSGNRWQTTSYAVGYASCDGSARPVSRGAEQPAAPVGHGRLGPGGADALVDARGRLVAGYHAWEPTRGHARPRQLGGCGWRELSRHRRPGVAVSSLVRQRRAGRRGALDRRAGVRRRIGPAADPATFRVNGTYAAGGRRLRRRRPRRRLLVRRAWSRSDGGWAGTAQPGVFSKTAMDGAEQAGTFLPVAGDFDGDGDDDIYWYQPGGDPLVAETCCNHEPLARRDSLWSADGDGTFSRRTSAGSPPPSRWSATSTRTGPRTSSGTARATSPTRCGSAGAGAAPATPVQVRCRRRRLPAGGRRLRR